MSENACKTCTTRNILKVTICFQLLGRCGDGVGNKYTMRRNIASHANLWLYLKAGSDFLIFSFDESGPR